MNLKPRRMEEPEINVVSLIDVVLLLVVFFMLSATFLDEGRVRIHLPHAGDVPVAHPKREPLVIAVTQAGGYRVNEHELINASPDTLRAALLKEAGNDRSGPVTIRADARATHQAVITAMDVLGRIGFVEINIATVKTAARVSLERQRARRCPRKLRRRAHLSAPAQLRRAALGMFAIGVLGMGLYAATDASTAWLVREFLNTTFFEHNPQALWFIPVAIIVLFFVRGVGDYVATYFPGWVGRQIIKAMRAELFAHYLRLPAIYYDSASSAQMLSRMTYNVELVAEASTNSVTVLIRDTLTIVALLGWLFYLDWQLTLIALTLAPLISFLLQRVNRLFRRYSARIQNSMGDVTRVAKEAIEGHRVIRVFNAQDYEQRAFDVVNEQNRHSNMRLVGARASSGPIVQLIAAIGLAVVMYFAIRQVLSHAMPVADFLSFLAGLLLISAPLRRLMQVFGPLQQGIAAGASVFEVLDTPVEDVGGGRALIRARGEVEYRNVHFEYVAEKGTVLRGINLRAPVGSTLAIVGKSGSGKSTLVSLLPRFYDTQQGSVLLDGVDVREYALADLRRQVALVSQDVVLFNDTIRNNIAFGTADATAQAVEDAARAAYVLEFADELPQGLDTLVGDRGALLSGGQRQRIAIARAILKDAPVLILDEATSSLDTHSERRIQAALAQLARNRTTLVIAHRLSTVEQADHIVVLDDGAVVESGTHAELLAQGGLYAQLYRLQFSA